MPALIAALLTAGTLLAGTGLLLFTLVWITAPTRHDLTHARNIATLGQSITTAGIVLLTSSGNPVAGPVLAFVILAAITTTVSLLTRAPLKHLRIA